MRLSWFRRSRPQLPTSADVPLCPPFHIRQILDRLKELGIPSVTIVVGRDPDEAALVRAVRRAGDLGLMAGIRGRGSDLDHGARISDMAAAGLARLEVYCLSDRDEVHDALAGSGDHKRAVRALAAARKHNVHPVAQLALVRSTLPSVGQTLESLAKHGLTNANLFAMTAADAAEASAGALLADEWASAAQLIEAAAERSGVQLLWQPPVEFDPTKPLGEQVCRSPRTSGERAIRVEPDGSVIPARGPFQSVGNLIEDEWTVVNSQA